MSSIAAAFQRPARVPFGVPVATVMVLGILGGLIAPTLGITLPLLVAIGCVVVWITIEAPGVLFGLYLTIPFYKGAVAAYTPIDITFGLAVLILLQVIPIVRGRRTGSVSRTGLVLWAALGVLVLAGVLWAPDQTLALDDAGTFLALVFVPLLVGAWRVGSDLRYVRQLLWTFFGMGVLTTVVGLPGITGVDRLVVLGANTINVAQAALLVPLLGLAFVVHKRSLRARILIVAISVPVLFVALATGSRGPLLVLIAVGVLGVLNYFAHPRSVDWPRTAAITVVACAGILLVSFLSPILPAYATDRFTALGDFVSGSLSSDIGSSSSVDTSSTARVALYDVATTMFEQRPVLGYGTSGFEAMSNGFLGYTEAYPHDALLQFAAEYGLVGAALFVCLIVAGLGRRLPELGRPVKILFIYILLEAMISGDIFADRTTWGLLLVLLLIQAPAVIRLAVDPASDSVPSDLLLTIGGPVA